MRELTPQEIAELRERIQAGDPSALRQAVQACKPPKPARVPKVPRRVTLTPEKKRLAGLKRSHTELSALHAQYMESRRFQSEARSKPEMRRAAESIRHDLFVANNDVKLHALLESFLHNLKFYFADLTDARPTD